MRSVRFQLACVLVVLLAKVAAAQPGVPVGSSTLIGTLDYSDAFTVGTPARPEGLYNNNSGGGYSIETAYNGLPAVTWTPFSNFSFNSGGVSTVAEYPGNNGNDGAASGLAQSGGGDWSLAYGLRSDYVVQGDATWVNTDRMDIGSYGAAGASIFAPSSLTVFFRKPGTPYPGIGIFNGTTETDSGFTSGIAASDSSWHNLAVRFNNAGKSVSIYVDETPRGTLDLSTFAGGIYQNYSSAAVGVGAGGYVGWYDNFQVGSPVTVISGTGSLWSATGASNSWSVGGNWQGGVPNAAGAVAIFSNSGAVITADLDSSSATLGSLTFNGSADMTISSSAGGNLIFDGGSGSAGVVTSLAGTHVISAPILMNNGLSISVNTGTLALSGVLSGSGQLTLLGGNVVLSNSNTYTGGTTIAGGALQLGDGIGNNGYVSGSITSSGIVIFANPNSQTFSGTISGGGSLRKSASGTLTLSGANSFAGATVNAGILQVSGGSNRMGTSPNLTINGGTLDLGGGTQNAGSITMNGGAFNNGSVNFSQNSAVSSGIINVNLANVGHANARVFIGGDPNGVIVLGGSNTHTFSDGYNTIIGYGSSAGTVQLANPSALGPATQTTDLYAGTLDLNGQSDLTNGGIRLRNDNGSAYFVNNSTATTASLPEHLTITLFNGNDGSLPVDGKYVGGPGNIQVAGPVVGPGMLTKIGTGVLILAGDTSYGGGTTVSAGTLQFGSGGSAGSLPSNDITNNAVLAFNRSDYAVSSNAVSGSGDVYQVGSGTLVLAGNNNYTGNTIIRSGNLYLNGSNSTPAISVASGATLGGGGNGSAAATTVTVADGGALDFSQNSTGSTFSLAGLTLSGNATIAVGNLGGYANTPVLSLGNDGGLAANGGPGSVSFALSGPAPTGSGAVELIQYTGALQGSGTAAFTYNTSGMIGLGPRALFSLSFPAGQINLNYNIDHPLWTGSGDATWTTAAQSPKNWRLYTSGSPTDFLTGDGVVFDDSAKGTTVSISAADVMPSAVTFNNTTAYTLKGVYGITGSATLFMNGTGSLTILNSNSYSGGTILDAGTLSILSGTSLGSGPITFNGGSLSSAGTGNIALASALVFSANATLGDPINNGVLTFSGSGTILVANVQLTVNSPAVLSGGISGLGGLTMLGPSLLTLSGVNTYSGSTSVSGGTLQFGDGVTAGAIPAGNIDVSPGASLIFANPLSQTYAGTITGNSAVVAFNGPGLLVLANALKYTSTAPTAISGGTLSTSSWNNTPLDNLMLGGSGTMGTLMYTGGLIWPGSAISNVTLATGGSGQISLKMGAGDHFVHIDGSTLHGSGTLVVDTAYNDVFANRFIVVSTTATPDSSGPITIMPNSQLQTNFVANTEGTPFGVGSNGLGPTITMGSGSVLDVYAPDSSPIIDIGSISGAGTLNDEAGTRITWKIGGDNTSTTFSGQINSAAALIKTGSGMLALSGTNTYTGGTTVTGGTLDFVGSSALLDGSSLAVGSQLSIFGLLVAGGQGASAAAPVVSAVPEPGTMALLIAAAAGLLAARRRSK
jgi:fibronectin-binding autotransporter adhesin